LEKHVILSVSYSAYCPCKNPSSSSFCKKWNRD